MAADVPGPKRPACAGRQPDGPRTVDVIPADGGSQIEVWRPEELIGRGAFDRFNQTIIMYGGPIVTAPDDGAKVIDLIRHYAHRMGGVHYDQDSAPEHPNLAFVNDHEQVLQQTMAAIGRIVVRALEPLALQVASELWFPIALDFRLIEGHDQIGGRKQIRNGAGVADDSSDAGALTPDN